MRRHGVAEQTLYRGKKKYGGLQVSDATRKRVAIPRNSLRGLNERWSMDFVSDALGDGRRFRA